ncbi:T9SS type A sorting domain-containing protein [Dyadobacter sp. 676]|uniref:T9SS type A sorting domain-containing protein n=1 Tax=Dyadobacter sp. 676 TaxID=3088362 RepID=A0AAU8FD28_9BACT
MSNCFGSVQKGITICVDNCAKGTPIYKIFPNPAKDQVKIQFEDVHAIEQLPQIVRLFSEAGAKEVREIQATEQYATATFEQDRAITVPVSDLPRGTYYLMLVNRDGSSENVRLVLE